MKNSILLVLILAAAAAACSNDAGVAGSTDKAAGDKKAKDAADDDDDSASGDASDDDVVSDDSSGGAASPTKANPYIWSGVASKTGLLGGTDLVERLAKSTALKGAPGQFAMVLITEAATVDTATAKPLVEQSGLSTDCSGEDQKGQVLVGLACGEVVGDSAGAAVASLGDKNNFCFRFSAAGSCTLSFKAADGRDLGKVDVSSLESAPAVPSDQETEPPVTAPPATTPQPAAKACNSTVGFIFPTDASSEADAKAKAMTIQNPNDDCTKLGCREASRQINFCDDGQAGAVGDGTYLCTVQYSCQN